MSGFLRFLGIVNAAIWLGAGISFGWFILPGVFSKEMHTALRLTQEPGSTYASGVIAQVLFHRYFILQYICAILALLHFLAQKLYLGRALSKAGLAVVLGVFALNLAGGVWLQPQMERLHKTKYESPSLADRELAGRSFGMWHGISQLANLLVLGGLVFHLVHVTRPDDSNRTITFNKFWG